jgi:uncharacterized membrane protein
VRLIEMDFYAGLFVPLPSPEWAENLPSPSLPISIWEAFGQRLCRNYIWIFLILYAAWMSKIWLFPEPAANLGAFIQRSSAGPIAGKS